MSRSKKKMAMLTSLQGHGEYIVTRKDCLLISKACGLIAPILNEKDNKQIIQIASVFSDLANQ